ncbi:hypothetical protein B0H11DRAFT_204862 [Mycena galericulata]|nr:hypothetical protein B0H11DRAFT_204862 [Mycena galericulata]
MLFRLPSLLAPLPVARFFTSVFQGAATGTLDFQDHKCVCGGKRKRCPPRIDDAKCIHIHDSGSATSYAVSLDWNSGRRVGVVGLPTHSEWGGLRASESESEGERNSQADETTGTWPLHAYSSPTPAPSCPSTRDAPARPTRTTCRGLIAPSNTLHTCALLHQTHLPVPRFPSPCRTKKTGASSPFSDPLDPSVQDA